MMDILAGVRQHLIVFICIFLIIIDVEHLSCASWPFVCLLRRNVCLGLVLIFLSGCLFLMLSSVLSYM